MREVAFAFGAVGTAIGVQYLQLLAAPLPPGVSDNPTAWRIALICTVALLTAAIYLIITALVPPSVADEDWRP